MSKLLHAQDDITARQTRAMFLYTEERENIFSYLCWAVEVATYWPRKMWVLTQKEEEALGPPTTRYLLCFVQKYMVL